LRVIHFHNGTGGGVHSIIRNLLLYQQDDSIEQHIVYTINSKFPPSTKILPLQQAKTERFFYHSPDWNFYYTCRQLAKHLPDEKTVIVANDWLELGMVSHLGLNNPVVLILHGDYAYYYELAIKHEANVDVFICIAANIANKLMQLLPGRENDIYYQRFPVRDPAEKTKFTGIKKLLFIGRCEKAKGYHVLPLIEQKLQQLNYELEWTVVGDGTDIEQVQWPDRSLVHFLKEIPNEEVLKLLPEHDLILLPSLAEGMPVSIIEAMKAGVIPVVNDIPGGIQELVNNGKTGYLVSNNKPEDFASIIFLLVKDFNLAKQISEAAKTVSHLLFNPVDNTREFELLYMKYSRIHKTKSKHKIYGSRLDSSLLPNFFVSFVRNQILHK
jgi:glycosyltransferase involved in cell wall biosynthesis